MTISFSHRLGGTPRNPIKEYSKANTLSFIGDSIGAANWSTTSDNYKSVNTHGAMEMANALLGQRFYPVNMFALGGSTAAEHLATQIPQLAASPTKYAFLSTGTNDLYVDLVSGSTAYSRITAVIEACLDLGVIPIWSTVRARAAAASTIDDHLYCNDLLKQYAARYNCGIFYDAYMIYQDPTATDGTGRSTFYYDTKVHPNNLGAYWEGKLIAEACRAAGVQKAFVFSHGAEDQTNDTAGRSNLLANPYFSGTGGTVSANCTGTMPDSWTIDWATRTGTGSAAASIVNVTDPDTGLAVAKGIQVVLSGTVANLDVLRITQASGFNTLLSEGNDMSAEGVIALTSPVAFRQVAMRVQTNTDESTWWGINPTATTGSVEDYPEANTFWMRTRKLAVKASGAADAARYDLRITFSGAATGTFVLSRPRVRKG